MLNVYHQGYLACNLVFVKTSGYTLHKQQYLLQDAIVLLVFIFHQKNQVIFCPNSDGGSLVALYVLSGAFGKGEDFGGSGAKVSHFGAVICSPGRRNVPC